MTQTRATTVFVWKFEVEAEFPVGNLLIGKEIEMWMLSQHHLCVCVCVCYWGLNSGLTPSATLPALFCEGVF
jgi:hypothetical protein